MGYTKQESETSFVRRNEYLIMRNNLANQMTSNEMETYEKWIVDISCLKLMQVGSAFSDVWILSYGEE